MILQFITKRNTYGHRKYLGIDTNAEIYARQSPRMIVEGIEIKSGDMQSLIDQCKRNEYREVERIY
jgi:glycerol-3-phosphate cytidylyltransferase-like family protein